MDYCFFKAIKYHLKDKDLPILASAFYSNYMLPARPKDTLLDIKKSRYKKVVNSIRILRCQVSTLLSEMEKNDVIKINEVSLGVAQIIEINRACDK